MYEPENSQHFELLAVGVAHGGTIKAVAEQIKCSIGHAYQISRTRAFRNRVNEIRSEAVSQSVCELVFASLQAVNTLRDCLQDVKREKGWHETAKIRITAAKAILSNLVPMQAHYQMTERVGELERDNAKILELEADA